MKKVYICSPYRASDKEQLDRNIKYAQELTQKALEFDYAPITPHLYIAQCLNEDKPEERKKGMAAGLELLLSCDLLILGNRYGISAGMKKELSVADAAGIKILNASRMCSLSEYAKDFFEKRFMKRT